MITPWTLTDRELGLLYALSLDWTLVPGHIVNDPIWTRLCALLLVDVQHSIGGAVAIRVTRAGWAAVGRYVH